ncbi:hypothetical protein E7T06_16160 [Deinococcus sp. Arct2-2]|uniref:hypothetical protein n=1 Tax=Deinococcus sp. Arct2-2 TaxID=2568653 RepID=UPI0010A32AFF|nr:hypothetical protein [Deinococcus sp. Arct2-2]THF68547.1 hypothetical protein E7T06_16160 [Deinococcus sp. Arct2-2]
MDTEPPNPGGMPLDDPRTITMLVTEHIALQGLRAATITDSSGRATLYLASISGMLVALSLLGSATRLGQSFIITALVVTPTLIFLGLATYLRVLQSALEDAFYTLGINRLRHLYLQLQPGFRPYFVQSDRDNNWGVLAEKGSARSNSWQILLTTAGSVGVINSVLIASYTAGILLGLHSAPPLVLVICSLIFVASNTLHFSHQQRAWSGFSQQHSRLFPSDDPTVDNVQTDQASPK